MSKRQQHSRRNAQEIDKYTENTPVKTKKPDNTSPKTIKKTKEDNPEEMDKITELYNMMKIVMSKLETLDLINERILSVEEEVKSLTKSIEFAHGELNDLKSEMKQRKKAEDECDERVKALEESNKRLHESVVDLKARSMRDNLLFHNIEEVEREDCTEVIYELLQEKLEIPDAKSTIKIERAHRVGRKRGDRRKPRAIVAKFNFYPDRERIRRSASKLKGTRIGISEQFPEEIEKVRQTLYPELRRAKAAGQRVRLVRDKLFINDAEFLPGSR